MNKMTDDDMMTDSVRIIVNSMKQFTGADLKKTRIKLDMTTDEFATALGIGRTSLYRMEKESQANLTLPFCCLLFHLRQHFGDLTR